LPTLQINEELRGFLHELPDLEYDRLISSYETNLPESFRVNTLKTEPGKIIPILEEEGYQVSPLKWVRNGYTVKPEDRLSHSIWYKLGLVYIQGAVSMLAAELLDIAPGQIVLDMCAAPGSKSTHIAMLLKGRGVVVANDVSTTRVKALASNLQRCGVLNSVITISDGRMFGRRARDFFDRVLLDAPCSSLGIISKDWSIARKWREKDSLIYSRLQKSLIISAYDSLKVDGILLYSTCTLHPLENEDVVAHLLEKRPSAELLEIRPEKLEYLHGLREWHGREYPPTIGRCIRIYPYHSGSEGFFFAKVRKRGEAG